MDEWRTGRPLPTAAGGTQQRWGARGRCLSQMWELGPLRRAVFLPAFPLGSRVVGRRRAGLFYGLTSHSTHGAFPLRGQPRRYAIHRQSEWERASSKSPSSQARQRTAESQFRICRSRPETHRTSLGVHRQVRSKATLTWLSTAVGPISIQPNWPRTIRALNAGLVD